MNRYIFGYAFGGSVIISSFLHFPSLNRPVSDVVIVLAFVTFGIFCGVQIIRRRKIGWLLFFCVTMFLIVLQTINAFQIDSVRLMIYLVGYTLWVAVGFVYYLRRKPLLS